ncbi:hypothetical protein [Nitrosovibrio sp. Nv4]|uniref:hypothetical protein n=1 Tax=Nitrosovibrio sp. Nv4 TaxID=1945880 RepID=UPI000BD52426|nr:hypothetical protein [Nitrosovibrio sp. Nv4]SOD42006.1 hypothetical protein SAMN06298226_2333 [Nitrosovibrio sp. Nv4]
MKKHHDQDVFGIAFTLFDHRSAAFRQKMVKHFQSNNQTHLTNVEKIPVRKRDEAAIFFKESA